MSFEHFKQLADQLKQLETELTQRKEGEPFAGFAGQMQAYQEELQRDTMGSFQSLKARLQKKSGSAMKFSILLSA